MQREIKRKVSIVVKVRPGRDDPVDETGPDQRDQAAHPQPGGVSAPESVRPTVQSGSRNLRVKTVHSSRSRPAL